VGAVVTGLIVAFVLIVASGHKKKKGEGKR